MSVKDHQAAIKRARERVTNYKVLSTAQCEKCGADCREQVALWVIDGWCRECRPVATVNISNSE